MVRTIRHIAFTLCLLSFSGFGQEFKPFSNRHLESWWGAKVDLKLIKDLDFSVEQQVRTTRQFTLFDRTLTEAEVVYDPTFHKFWKPLSIGAGARYIGLWDANGAVRGWENHFRFHFDFAYTLEIGRFFFQARHRWQHRNEIGISAEEGDYPARDFRTRITFSWNFKNWKLDPIISYESFVHNEMGQPNGFAKWRLKLGTNYKVNKKLGLSFFYIREQATTYWNPRINHIIGAKLKYKIRRKEKDPEDVSPRTH